MKVLVIDDEPDIRGLLAEILSDMGHQVSQGRNGLEALEKAKEENPDLIFLDVLMPVMDGLQALRSLREDPRTTAIPVVLLTAFSGIQPESNGTVDGAIYLAKPWPLGAVEQVLRNVSSGAAPGP